jgi:mono/diheme cytochrome c family protein
MPPFAQQLSNAEIAAVVNYIRRDSNPSSQLSASDIAAMQGIVLE